MNSSNPTQPCPNDDGRTAEGLKVHMRTWELNPAPVYPKMMPLLRSEFDRVTRTHYVPRDCDLKALVHH